MRRGVINATAFAIAMANVETMIVVYLRRLYHPAGFAFPLGRIDPPTYLLELTREACTLAMLATFGIAAGRTKVGKGAYFLLVFGLWDIFYYVWLKIFLHWPASLFTWDILFLIPIPWVGPVLAPVSVACTMIAMDSSCCAWKNAARCCRRAKRCGWHRSQPPSSSFCLLPVMSSLASIAKGCF